MCFAILCQAGAGQVRGNGDNRAFSRLCGPAAPSVPLILPELPRHFDSLAQIDLSVVRGNRRCSVSQDGTSRIKPEFATYPGRRRVPELVRVPSLKTMFQAGNADGV